jgi:hypothetical protein
MRANGWAVAALRREAHAGARRRNKPNRLVARQRHRNIMSTQEPRSLAGAQCH